MARGQVGVVLRYLRKLAAPPCADDPSDRRLVERFAAARDEAAFAALLQRHGPMVRGVCRRLLRDPNDADDAFQATFLVLAYKAGGLRRPERLGNWLYGVARRVAAKARAAAARRRARQEFLADVPAPEPDAQADRRELRRLLDEAIGRLPDKYRAPVVLCYLEGKTYAEAARELGWAEGTVSGRMARARELLRRRLSRDAGLSAGVLAAPPPADAVSAGLVRSTIQAALRAAAGDAGGAPLRTAALARGVVREMSWSRVKLASAMLAAIGVVGGGALALAYGRPPAPGGSPHGPGPAAVKVVVKEPDFGDTASILHIQKRSAEVQFRGKVNAAELVLQFYKDGKPAGQVPAFANIDVSGIADKPDAARVSLQAADLDYLPLAGGEKGHCRLRMELALGPTARRARGTSRRASSTSATAWAAGPSPPRRRRRPTCRCSSWSRTPTASSAPTPWRRWSRRTTKATS
jgi:RNA polymerase sigma factor (sigma-70 family)